MSKMGDFVIAMGEEYQRRHPNADWDKAMSVVTSGSPEAKNIENYVWNKQYRKRG